MTSGAPEGVIDCHVHAWDRRALSYSWMAGSGLPHTAGVPDRMELDSACVRGVILVEAGVDPAQRPAETEWMLAQVGPEVVGVIAAAGWEDVSVPEVRAGLVGVRINILGGGDERDAARRIAETVAAASSSRLPVDVLCSSAELGLVVRSLELADDAVVVIDHLGRPPVDEGLRSEAGREWYRALEALSRHSGVRMKISAVSTASTDFVAATLDLFGTDRCVMGSDWPMNASGSYGDRMRDVISAAGGLIGSAVGATTAESVYSIRLSEKSIPFQNDAEAAAHAEWFD